MGDLQHSSMNDTSLIERITRSLAFMLRHQPEKFDLELDVYGHADVDEVVRALNERLGEPVVEADLVEAVQSGDRARYEIQGRKIRALYGHSIPVEPGAASKPPEVLYVAIPERDVERATRFGLRGGRRRFLHLALSVEDAQESGRRIAEDYTVLTINALDAWEEGINFYDRHALWLAEEVPTHLIEVGETFHDGQEPIRRGPRGGRSRERGRSGGRGRDGGRGRGRGRAREERSRDEGRGHEDDAAARAERFEDDRDRSAQPEGARSERGGRRRGRRGDSDRGRRDDERPQSADRDEREPREERGARPGRGGSRRAGQDRGRGRQSDGGRGRDREPVPGPERKAAERKAGREATADRSSRSEPEADFGAGLIEPSAPARRPERTKRSSESKRSEEREPREETRKPARQEPVDDGSSFGAGL